MLLDSFIMPLEQFAHLDRHLTKLRSLGILLLHVTLMLLNPFLVTCESFVIELVSVLVLLHPLPPQSSPGGSRYSMLTQP